MENYLVHFGILGMKWGVRRFQNPDGTLTAEGKRHYDTYKEQYSKGRKLHDEANRLINSNKYLKWGFDNIDNVDDWEYFEMEAEEAVGKNAMKKYWELKEDSRKFLNEHQESIDIGYEIAKKLLKER